MDLCPDVTASSVKLGGGSADLNDVLSALAVRRPIFHSEADFQHEFAWEIRMADAHLAVRLECRPTRSERLDVLVRNEGTGFATAVELKYLTAAITLKDRGEEFSLLHQGAQDIRGFDSVADIARVERFVASGYASDGLVLILSNDRSYWTDPAHGRQTGAGAYRLYEGTVLDGSRAWSERSGPGTRRGREGPIELTGSYSLNWRGYSDFHVAAGRFRILPIIVSPTIVETL